MAACRNQFKLQEELIAKHAGVITEILGKECAGDYHAPEKNCALPEQEREQLPHPIYWEAEAAPALLSAEEREYFMTTSGFQT